MLVKQTSTATPLDAFRAAHSVSSPPAQTRRESTTFLKIGIGYIINSDDLGTCGGVDIRPVTNPFRFKADEGQSFRGIVYFRQVNGQLDAL